MLTIRKMLVMGWIILILFVLFSHGDTVSSPNAGQAQTTQTHVTQVYTVMQR